MHQHVYANSAYIQDQPALSHACSTRQLKEARNALQLAETTSQEAWRTAAATSAAQEEQTALIRGLQRQLAEAEARHASQVTRGKGGGWQEDWIGMRRRLQRQLAEAGARHASWAGGPRMRNRRAVWVRKSAQG